MEKSHHSKETLNFPPGETILPFQVEAIEKMLRFLRVSQCTYNACEMGLGKSIQTIVAVNTLFNELEPPNVLVVCPATMKYVWVSEIEKWNTLLNKPHGTRPVDILVIDKPSQLNGQIANYTIISYGLVAKLAPALAEFDWDVLILDEAHYLKDHTSQRSKALFKHLWPNIKYKIALSGTPFTTNVIDGWSIFSRMHESLKDYWKFAHSYTNVRFTPWGKKFEGVKNASKLSRIIRDNFYIRYLKKDVLPELPDKIHQTIHLPSDLALESTEEQKKEQEDYLKKVHLALINGYLSIPQPPISIMTQRRLQGLKKLPFTIEYIEEFLDQDIPVIVFALHKEFIRELATYFVPYKPAVITGETKSFQRASEVNHFQSGGTKLFIGNLIAAGVGITLTASSHVILAEYDFIPSTITQAISRAHRIGQKDTVYVHHLIIKDSLEERVLKLILRKQSDFNKVLDQVPT